MWIGLGTVLALAIAGQVLISRTKRIQNETPPADEILASTLAANPPSDKAAALKD